MLVDKDKFKVEITETLQRTVEIEAVSSEDAIETVNMMYKCEDVVLGWSDFVDVSFGTS